MQIAAGCEGGNDCNTLCNEGVLKVFYGEQEALATQPTMCRFDNQLNSMELYAVTKVFANGFISSYPSQPEAIILDCEDTILR